MANMLALGASDSRFESAVPEREKLYILKVILVQCC